MPRGGSKPGEHRGGRKKGTPNKSTQALKAAIEKAGQKLADALGEDCFDGDSHDLLMSVYKDKSQPIALRVDAAKVAIGFEKPRLAATELSGNLGMTHEERLAFLNENPTAKPNGKDEPSKPH